MVAIERLPSGSASVLLTMLWTHAQPGSLVTSIVMGHGLCAWARAVRFTGYRVPGYEPRRNRMCSPETVNATLIGVMLRLTLPCEDEHDVGSCDSGRE